MPIGAIIVLFTAGLIVGELAPHQLERLFGQATLYVFLPALLFEAAWNLDAAEMRAAWWTIFVLTVPGVLTTSFVVGAALVFIAHLPWTLALVIGAMVSATDPIAVVAIVRRVRIPTGLSTILQSEALLNDAVAVVAYRALLAAALVSTTWIQGAQIAVQSLAAALAGIALGALAGILLSRIILRRNQSAVQIAATLAGVYAVYFGCDALGLSGIFAVISFGIALRAAENASLSADCSSGVERFWDRAAAVANGCVFFLTGCAITVAELPGYWIAVLAGLTGILLARIILAYGFVPVAMARRPAGWLDMIRAAGARGALSLALAIALPGTLMQKPLAIAVTAAIMMATLLTSTVTVPRAANRLAV